MNQTNLKCQFIKFLLLHDIDMVNQPFLETTDEFMMTTKLNEWKRLEDYLAPTNVFDMDDFVCKQWLIFLRTYAMYFG